MNARPLLLTIVVATGIGAAGTAVADGWRHERGQGHWWRGDWKEEYRDGPCTVKEEAKRDEFKREIKCKDGIGARWHGEFKREFRDGPCRVQIDTKHDEYKEEVKCDG